MTNKQLDLVVVGFTGELKMLELQARSIRLFAPDVFSHIIYVVNDQNFRAFEQFFEQKIVPELGPAAPRAQLMDGKNVAGGKLDRTDWRSQQSLKLLAARHVLSPQFLVLDSKNHFIRPVEITTFIAADGRLKTHRYSFNEKFRSKFDNACQYFGVAGPGPDLEAMPTATPFLMSTKAVCALISDVETREKKPFQVFFTESGNYTEFYFYFAYLLSKPGLLGALYVTRSRPQVTLFRSAAQDPKKLRELLPVLDRADVYCFGVHRAVFEAADAENQKSIADVWLRFGLVQTRDECTYFQTPDTPIPKRRFGFF